MNRWAYFYILWIYFAYFLDKHFMQICTKDWNIQIVFNYLLIEMNFESK